MRNVITVVALMVSIIGIFVSLAREELRCRLGLQSAECRSFIPNSNELTNHSKPTSPNVKESLSESSTTPLVTPRQSSTESRSPEKNAEPTPETSGTKILKSTGEKLTQPTEGVNPEASPAESSVNQVSPPQTADAAPPPQESGQLEPKPDPAIAHEQKPDPPQSHENQPIQVIPPTESPQP
ncbi:MAG: hypothetical protein VKJ02_19200 [Snowella sp.]|nr:hypothetical protein [Snowella sp.]